MRHFIVHRKHEALFVGPADCPFMKYTRESLRKYPGFEGMGYMSNDALRKQYPTIHFSDDCVGLLDASEFCLAADVILEHILVSISILKANIYLLFLFYNSIYSCSE